MGSKDVTVGICAYNEERNIERCIRSVYSQRTRGFRIGEIIVVSSGSTDRTDDIVRSLQHGRDEIRLIRQERREGKNSAINALLDAKSCDLVVMLNADNVLATEDSLWSLLEPLEDERIGIVGGHPVPVNDIGDRVGFAVHMIWSMHHNLATIHPKVGELVAFRDVGARLPTDQQSDEPLLRMYIERAGYEPAYAPEATVFNRGPDTEEDFLKQRTRINIGICFMKARHGYSEPSWNRIYLMRAALRTFKDLGFHPLMYAYAARLEIRSRRDAERYVRSGNGDMSVWDPVDSTKKV